MIKLSINYFLINFFHHKKELTFMKGKDLNMKSLMTNVVEKEPFNDHKEKNKMDRVEQLSQSSPN